MLLGKNAGDCVLDHDVGACAIGRGAGGVGYNGSLHLSSCWVAVTAWVRCASIILFNLVISISTLRIGAATLGMCIACCGACAAQTLLRMVLAFATSFFAIAILVNSTLTFHNASAVSFPVGKFPWSTIVSCCAAATMWDSGEMVGLVMYWCLNNTISLICVALVLVMYTRKHR